MKKIILYSLIIVFVGCNRNKSDFDATGAFEATEVLVSAEANGKIMELDIKEGDRLEAGTVVGYIDSIQLHYTKMQLIAGLRSVDFQKPDIRKQIAVLEQQIATQRTEQRRMENLVNARAGNRKQLDDILHQIDYLQKQLDAQYSTLSKTTGSADAESDRLIYQIMQLDDQIRKSRIVNPQTGTVLVKYAEAGEVTGIGWSLYKIADIDMLYLRAYITADQLSQIQLGQSVRTYSDFGNDHREYTGTITWISDKAEFTPKGIQTKNERANLVYAIKIGVKNDGFLKIGQYGEVKF